MQMFTDLFTPPILEFKGPYRFLSNFFVASFVWDNIIWPTSEHAYQAAKSLDRPTRLAFAKLPTPNAAKQAGKTVKLRPDWEEVKVSVMRDIVRAKFTQNPALKQLLLVTDNAVLEEGNTWKDRTWGICPPGSGIGLNYLGKLLMELRTEWQIQT